MKNEELPEELKKMLKIQGLTLKELVESKKAHLERVKRIKKQLNVARSMRTIEVK